MFPPTNGTTTPEFPFCDFYFCFLVNCKRKCRTGIHYQNILFKNRIETTFLFYRAKSIIATAILLISPQQLPPLYNICASYKQIIVMVAVSIVAFIIVVFSLYRLYRRCRCCIHHRSSRYTTIFGCNFCNSSPPTINLN
jgi:hypothetical protein